MREIRLHDTRAGALALLVPRKPGRVAIYACGPTVYERIHVGNARPYVVFSQLARFLEHEGYATTLAINITDVNDKIYTAASAAGVASADLALDMTRYYRADTDALGLGRPDQEPLASESIESMVGYISELIETGHAYAADGDVFFRVRSDPAYGSLSHRVLEDMDQGEGIEGSERKEDPLDFALWKGHKPDEDTAWDAPWGRGRPGWHIECSAMAEDLLGVGFEIHGGGSDLVFPHHENEIAQTEAGRGRPLARIWMHNGMLQLEREKMSKSVGNITSLRDALDELGPETLKMYFVGAHYRSPMPYGESALADARQRVERLRDLVRRLAGDGPEPPELDEAADRFFDALADDFNTPRALAAVFDWIREANRRQTPVGAGDLREMLAVLGLENLLEDVAPSAPGDIAALAARRQDARDQGEFAEADRLRDEIASRGWQVRDVAGGFELVPR